MRGERIDKRIIERVNDGDEEAFSQLYNVYYLPLNALAFYYLNNKNASREIVNDVFLKAYNKRETLAFPVYGYLAKAVRNGCIDFIRAQNARRRTLKDHTAEITVSYQEQYIRSDPQPLQYVKFKETEEEIKNALAQLPTRCRQIFEAHFYHGKSVEEIAEDLNIKSSTVRVQLKNALDGLKSRLKHLLVLFL